ncbi:hypothetical protein ACFQX6_60360 [Streptosporangium lutulentum]
MRSRGSRARAAVAFTSVSVLSATLIQVDASRRRRPAELQPFAGRLRPRSLQPTPALLPRKPRGCSGDSVPHQRRASKGRTAGTLAFRSPGEGGGQAHGSQRGSEVVDGWGRQAHQSGDPFNTHHSHQRRGLLPLLYVAEVCGDRLRGAGSGANTPRRAVTEWMGSNTHRPIILNPAFRDFGVGVRPGSANPTHTARPNATYVATFGFCQR